MQDNPLQAIPLAETKAITLEELTKALQEVGKMSPEAKAHIFNGSNNSLKDYRAGQEAAREDIAKGVALGFGSFAAAAGIAALIWKYLKN